MHSYIILAAIVVVIGIFIWQGRIVQQAETMVIERLGKFHRVLKSGVNIIIPGSVNRDASVGATWSTTCTATPDQ